MKFLKRGATPQKKPAHRGRAKAKAGNKPYLFWLLGGILAGVLITSSIFLQFAGNSSDKAKKTAKSWHVAKRSSNPTAVKKLSTNDKSKSKFDFYTMLSKASNLTNLQGHSQEHKPSQLQAHSQPHSPPQPKLQNQASSQVKASKAKHKKPSSLAKKASDHSLAKVAHKYVIQAGSFRNMTDADRLRAQLTLEGFEPKVETVSISNEKPRYKVILGPFSSEQQALMKQKELERQTISGSLVLKRKD